MSDASRRSFLTVWVCLGLALFVGGFWSASDARAQSTDPPVPIDAADAGPAPASAPAPDDDQRPAIPSSPQQILKALGWWFVAPFLGASFISLWFGLERFVVLRRGRVIPKAFIDRFLRHLEQGSLEPQKALDLCEENNSPLAMVFAHGIRKWGRPSVEVEQAIIDGGERQVSLLRKHLRVLNGVATVTPLIGLLGTVIGMINAFNDIAIADAMGKATQLASGIALALLTTAAGLIIAIPSLILYMYLSGKVDSLVMEMDRYAQSLVNLISSEAQTTRPAEPRRTAEKKAS